MILNGTSRYNIINNTHNVHRVYNLYNCRLCITFSRIKSKNYRFYGIQMSKSLTSIKEKNSKLETLLLKKKKKKSYIVIKYTSTRTKPENGRECKCKLFTSRKFVRRKITHCMR